MTLPAMTAAGTPEEAEIAAAGRKPSEGAARMA